MSRCTYFVVYNSPLNTRSYPYGSYEQARIALAKIVSTFAREGAMVVAHNDNYANLIAHTTRGDVSFTLTIYNNSMCR